jgi:c-di-GMP-binding flagellar brake protein YcgR
MDTLPLPYAGAGAIVSVLDDCILSTFPEVHALLKRLLDGNVTLHLNTPHGAVHSTTLWAIDPSRAVLNLFADAVSPQLQRVLEADEVTVVGYLERSKVQFELNGLMLVHGAHGSVLNAQIPQRMFRFQRRNSLRVRPLGGNSPAAYFAHPMIPEMQLALRVLDVGIGGCALFLPDDVPTVDPGVRINRVRLELDASTRVHAAVIVHHVTAINPESGGVRLGCELVGLSTDAIQVLQSFIDQTEKRLRTPAV